MPHKGLDRVIQEEIWRLKELKKSQREVANLLGINRLTVRKYWDGPSPVIVRPAPNWSEEVDWDYVKSELKKGITREILYQELGEVIKLPSYQNFCKMISKKIPVDIEISYKIERVPGGSFEVDYAGRSIDLLSPATGEIIKTELFVGVLSYSLKIYAEFTYSQKLEDWIASHNRMFQFYGGTAGSIICDNLKSGVTRPCKLDPLINKTYHEQCIHYGVVVDPADTRKAKHKPNVEKAVDIIQRGFLAEVRNKTYTSLGELNSDLRSYLKRVNAKVMKARGFSRDQLFEKEKEHLNPLPKMSYQFARWKLAKVHPDCHIQHEYNYYSVPHRYVGKQVEVKYNQELVEIFISGDRIAIHQASRGRAHYSTNEEHYPDKRLVQLQVNYQRIIKQAQAVGENTAALIHKLFNEERFPLKKLRRVQAILSLEKKYSKVAVEYACEQALELNKRGYRFIESCARTYRPEQSDFLTKAPIRDKNFICLQGGNCGTT